MHQQGRQLVSTDIAFVCTDELQLIDTQLESRLQVGTYAQLDIVYFSIPIYTAFVLILRHPKIIA